MSVNPQSAGTAERTSILRDLVDLLLHLFSHIYEPPHSGVDSGGHRSHAAVARGYVSLLRHAPRDMAMLER
jgi:hypothetical protein